MQQQKQQFDIYGHVTNTIISMLEQGTIPWRKPWITTGPPRNLLTRHWYKGINHLLLNALPYEQPYYLSFNQVQSVAARVKKGEKGHLIVFSKKIIEPDPHDATKKVERFFVRYHYVFNIAQCENIPPHLFPRHEAIMQHADPIEECDFIVEDYTTCPTIRLSGEEAYYVCDRDFINMPPREKFANPEAFYAALNHELIHSTGHESRLNRKEVMENPEFGSEEYAFEELVGEIGACYLCSFCGIASKVIENSAAYIDNWLQALRNDKRFIVFASARAQRAVDYILNIDRSAEKSETMPEEQAGV